MYFIYFIYPQLKIGQKRHKHSQRKLKIENGNGVIIEVLKPQKSQEKMLIKTMQMEILMDIFSINLTIIIKKNTNHVQCF